MELTNWSLNPEARQRDRRAIIAGYENVLDFAVQEGDNSGIPGTRTEDGITSVWGFAVEPPSTNGIPLQYRQNIKLRMGGSVVLQRIGMPEYNKKPAQYKAIAEGRKRVARLQEVAIANQGDSRNDKKAHPVFHLGLWTGQGHPDTVLWSKDTKQDSKQQGRDLRVEVVDDFLLWARGYFIGHIEPYLRHRRNTFKVASEIRQQLETREEAFKTLCRSFPAAEKLLHSAYSMVTPFTTFSPKTHKDRNDADFSILANFGASCWLVLPELQLRVHLQPNDVVVFRSNKLQHHTVQVQEDADSSERWSVSYYMRDTVQKDAIKQALQEAKKAASKDDMLERAKRAESRG